MTFSSPNGSPSDFRPSEPAVQTSGVARMPAAPVPLPTAQPAPGWYVEPGKPGVLRYWNGVSWEEWRKPLVEAPSVTQGQKNMGIAYLLAVLVGCLGIHNFYLGRIGAGVGQLVLWLLFLLTAVFLVGSVFLIAVAIWVIVDLCLIPSYVRAAALRAVGPQR